MGQVPPRMGEIPKGDSEIVMREDYPVQNAKNPQAIINLLDEKIYEFNSSTIEKHDGMLFAKTVQDEHGAVIAGIAGWTWACACEITLLWVNEGLRRKGIGKKLLMAAEEEAKDKECNIILIRSYSFQAPLFYEQNGYKIEHVIEGFPPGHNYYTLIKTISVRTDLRGQ